MKTIPKQLISLLLVATTLSGCATVYRGPGPDLTAPKGSPKAQEQIQKFTISKGWFNNMLLGDQMYTESSILPVMREVSPSAHDAAQSAQTLNAIGTTLFLVGIVGFGGSYAARPTLTAVEVIGTSLWAGGLGISLFANYRLNQAVDQYNFDLRRKLEAQTQSQGPGAEVAFQF